jgi:dTMP kinase
MMSKQGKFITVEGIEGAGKSTAIKFIQEYLVQHSIDVVVTREPGGTEIAEAIRRVLLDYYEEDMSRDAELLLFFAARAQHIARVIKPALAAGKVVLCDRFTDASFAYQCGGRGIDEDHLAVLETWVQGDLRPDLTILMDLPVDVGMERARNRSAPDRFEAEQHQFFERVRQCYLDRAKRYSERFRIVDAGVSLDEIKQSLFQLIDGELGIKNG